MRKKYVSLLLAVSLAASLSGCGKKANSAAGATIPTETTVVTEATTAATEAPTAATEETTQPETTQATEATVHVHKWGEWVTTKEPTTTSKGINTRTCSVCGETETQEVAKLKPSHVHRYQLEVKAPTCVESGSTRHYCSCGSVYWTDRTEALGHKWSAWKTVKESTESSVGTKERTCSVCKQTETDTIPMLNHKHTYTTQVVAATCTTDGYTLHRCACGDSYKDNAVKAKGHTWGGWVTTKEPTETTTGINTRTCSVCKQTESQTIDKLEHTHKYTDQVVAATCTTGGYTEHTCSCGASYKDNQTSATGHTWGEWVTTKQPTESENGVKTRTCSVCKQTETASIDKIQHEHNTTLTDSKAATCTENGYEVWSCACGYEARRIIPAGHKWEHHHEDAQGHYTPVMITCHCGWSCSADIDYGAAFQEHLNSLPVEERYEGHSYYSTGGDFVVDVPAKDWDVCTVCGATK